MGADGRLAGKVAIVTGAGRGQGEGEARLFVAEGARVVLTDVLVEEGRAVAAELGAAARFVAHDVADPDAWTRVVDTTVDTFGRVDVLVNNAAIQWMKRLEDETKEGFSRILEVNLVGTFLGVRAVTGAMRAAGGGSIVNISSTAGLTGMARLGAYGASKWGVRGLTKTAALELGSDRIRVNSIHPGPVNSPQLRPSQAEYLAPRMPIGRVGEVVDVAELVVYLASDASTYVTGAEFVIDGGSMAGVRPVE
jgi:3alpha(or 20beta)-hydroxysteroid dehydrogenase